LIQLKHNQSKRITYFASNPPFKGRPAAVPRTPPASTTFLDNANPDRTPMPPTSLAIQLDTGASAGISTVRLHGIGGDFVMTMWQTAPAGHQGHVVRRSTMRMNGTVYWT
jgi:hypothetical protein